MFVGMGVCAILVLVKQTGEGERKLNIAVTWCHVIVAVKKCHICDNFIDQ